jgi:hypothetical protein
LTVARGCALLAAFAAIALTVVHLRAEQTRCAARMVAIDADGVRLRRDLWGLQTRIARLRSPERIHDRVAAFQTGLVPPGFDELSRRTERLESSKP